MFTSTSPREPLSPGDEDVDIYLGRDTTSFVEVCTVLITYLP